MAKTIADLVTQGIDSIKLDILVFGPAVDPLSANDRTRNLQLKRLQIRDVLVAAGHNAKYAEELVDPAVASAGNAFFQELLIMQEYDLIVNIVDSPGSIAEAAVIGTKPDLARKSALFLDSAYQTGLVASTCQNAADLGAHFQLYTYPTDLTDCHLLGHVEKRVQAFQRMKYLL